MELEKRDQTKQDKGVSALIWCLSILLCAALVACVIVDFLCIHPFADGNGRTGRLVMNYLLLLNDHPPIIIHEEDRKGYYAALEAWDERQELDQLIRYLQEQTAKTWEKQIERAERRSDGQAR